MWVVSPFLSSGINNWEPQARRLAVRTSGTGEVMSCPRLTTRIE